MKNNKMKNIINIFVVMILLIIIGMTIYGYTRAVKRNADMYAQFTLDEIISLQKEAIYSQLIADRNMIESLAISFQMGDVSLEQAVEIVTSSLTNNGFQEIIIFDLEGNGYSTEEDSVRITDIEQFKTKESSIYESALGISEENILKISTPVLDGKNGNIKYVIVGVYGLDKVKELIEKTICVEDIIGVLDSQGKLIFSNKLTSEMFSVRTKYVDNLLSNVKVISGDTNMTENLSNGVAGSFVYEYEKQQFYCKYMSLGINDWFVVVHINKTDLLANINYAGNDAIVMLLVIGICVSAIAIYFLLIKIHTKKELANLALYDKLTGLPTSEKFKMDITKLVSENENCYCMVFDICNFKLINDRFGSGIGDTMLVKIADVMREIQKSNGKDTIYLSKLYSDTFALLAVNMSTVELNEKAKLFIGKCKEASGFIGEYNLNLSCGRYKSQKGDTAEIVLERALTAHAHSKGQKPNIFVDYDNAFLERLHTQSEILDDFSKAIKNGEFHIYPQPQYSACNEEISGAELLVRWIKDGKIKYPPNIFIPVLEDAGRISELDSYLREQACRTMRKWLDEGIHVVPISLNVSRVELLEENFVEKLLALVKKYDLDPSLLHIEITETAYVGDYNYLISVVEQLSSHGFHVEMDDFGSGYSSLNVLKDIPIDIVKLDMKFVEKGENEARSGSILSAVVRMTQGIDLLTIAEGVETRDQIDYLRSIGCDYMQGYYFAKPMPIKEFEEILKGEEVKASWKIKEDVGIDQVANFLNATAQETLLFNTFLGGAAIIEYSNDNMSVIRLNDKCYEVFGKTKGSIDFFKYNLFEIISIEYREYIKRQLEKAIETGEEVSGECSTVPLDENDSIMWQRYSLRCLGKKGNRYTFYLVLNDITDRKTLEENLKEEIRKSQALIASMPGGYIKTKIVDGIIRLVDASEGICKRLEYTLEELQALDNFNTLIHPKDLERVVEAQKETIVYNKPFALDLCYLNKSGNTIWFSCTGTYIQKDNQNGFFDGFFYDITALHEAKEKVEAFVNNTSDGYGQFVIKAGQIYTEYISDGFCKMGGYTYEEVMSMHINDFAHPDDLEMIEMAEYNTIVNGAPFRVEYRYRCKNGTYIWMRVVGRYVQTDKASGNFYGSFFNIEHYKQVQQELEELKEQLKQLQNR